MPEANVNELLTKSFLNGCKVTFESSKTTGFLKRPESDCPATRIDLLRSSFTLAFCLMAGVTCGALAGRVAFFFITLKPRVE